jgi:hypothetical protein
MAGHIRRLVRELIEVRARGNPTVEYFLKAHLALQGINADDYRDDSPDDPAVEHKLLKMINEFQRKA